MLLASPILGVLLLLRLRAGKSRDGWKERWGHIRLPEIPHGRRVWFHAASVGEVTAAVPVVRALRSLREDIRVIFTVITPGGYETACAQAGRLVDTVHYAPFDVPWAVARSVRAIRPDALVVMETEIWPNMLHYARKAGARVILINGRISDRSFPRYLLARGLFTWALGYFDRILGQTSTDAERFRAIGGRPERIEATGNTKFDEDVKLLGYRDRAKLHGDLKLPCGAPVLVIGSTRAAEEERILIRAFMRVRETIPDLTLIHAPRHTDRAEEVSQIMREAGLDPTRKTEIDSTPGPVRALVLDTFGELADIYAIADVAYIGNSLVSPGGGQNLLQPLAHGKPAVYGPYMQNFRDLASMAEDAGVGFKVSNEDELVSTLTKLLTDSERRAGLSDTARNLVAGNRGASERYANEIVSLLQAGRERE